MAPESDELWHILREAELHGPAPESLNIEIISPPGDFVASQPKPSPRVVVLINRCISCHRLDIVPRRGITQCYICRADKQSTFVPKRVKNLRNAQWTRVMKTLGRRLGGGGVSIPFWDPPRRPLRRSEKWFKDPFAHWWRGRPGYDVAYFEKDQRPPTSLPADFWELFPTVVRHLRAKGVDPTNTNLRADKWLYTLARDGLASSESISDFIRVLARRPIRATWYLVWAESWLTYRDEEMMREKAITRIAELADDGLSVRAAARIVTAESKMRLSKSTAHRRLKKTSQAT